MQNVGAMEPHLDRNSARLYRRTSPAQPTGLFDGERDGD
jgi:hypothetical protein